MNNKSKQKKILLKIFSPFSDLYTNSSNVKLDTYNKPLFQESVYWDLYLGVYRQIYSITRCFMSFFFYIERVYI